METMTEIEELKKTVQELEEKFNEKVDTLYKYKRVQITIKIITFIAISCLMLMRSGKIHDIYLWCIGFYMMLLATAELFSLEEIIFIHKENKKVFQKKHDKT